MQFSMMQKCIMHKCTIGCGSGRQTATTDPRERLRREYPRTGYRVARGGIERSAE